MGVACVTQDRPGDVDTLIDALRVQTEPVASLCLVDAGRAALDEDRLRHRWGSVRVALPPLGGGAWVARAALALAILTALAAARSRSGSWTTPTPRPECLAVLRTAARERDLAVVSPLIVAPQD
ncbi:hypothetical protein QJS66_00175 [Kocuria rhizophila]|nr:hypothetical protein QJS66_00175 [Kocuria rhizophila]